MSVIIDKIVCEDDDVYYELVNSYVDSQDGTSLFGPLAIEYNNELLKLTSKENIVEGRKKINIVCFENKQRKIMVKQIFEGKGLGKGGPKAYYEFEITTK